MLLSVALAKYNHSLLVQETTSLRPSIQIVTSILTLHPLAFSYRLFLIFHNSVLLNLTSTYLPAITINLFISTDSGIFFNEVEGVRAFLRTLMWKLCRFFFSFKLKQNIHSKHVHKIKRSNTTLCNLGL